MSKAVRGIVVGVAAAALALTGCAQPPGAAARVNGVDIPDSVVREATSVVSSQLGMAESTVLRQVAVDITMAEASTQLAARNGVEVSQARIDEALQLDPRVDALADIPASRAWAEGLATTYVVIDQMGSEAYARQLRELPISINPRYGTWDSQNLDLSDSSLSRVQAPQSLG